MLAGVGGLWDNPQTLHFYDFRIFEHVLCLQDQFLLEAPGYRKESKKSQLIFEKFYCCKFQNVGNQKFEHAGHGGAKQKTINKF